MGENYRLRLKEEEQVLSRALNGIFAKIEDVPSKPVHRTGAEAKDTLAAQPQSIEAKIAALETIISSLQQEITASTGIRHKLLETVTSLRKLVKDKNSQVCQSKTHVTYDTPFENKEKTPSSSLSTSPITETDKTLAQTYPNMMTHIHSRFFPNPEKGAVQPAVNSPKHQQQPPHSTNPKRSKLF